MTFIEPIQHTIRRILTLQTDHISALPIVILMPHSACNCRCAMCDIWKGNAHAKKLEESDIASLLESLKKLGTRQVVMSGGEALLNPNFFRFCEMLCGAGLSIVLLSTGLTLERHAVNLVRWVDEIIVSLDGDEALHDQIRQVPGAFAKLSAGIKAIKSIAPGLPIRARTVIHRLNAAHWPLIIQTAKQLGLDQISFLPADVSSTAFNRPLGWAEDRQNELLPDEPELHALDVMTRELPGQFKSEFESRFIAESPEKIRQIYEYYGAHRGLNDFPYRKCNAPWVSAVVEVDGSVRPCFFHEAVGNIRQHKLSAILNNEKALSFRKTLNMRQNSTCIQCVCSLHLSPGVNPVAKNTMAATS